MTKKELEEKKQEDAKEKLRELLPVGSVVYTILKHVSRSGMMRVISAYIYPEGSPHCLDDLIETATNMKYNYKHEGIQMSGCGMDMGFALVYGLSYSLYPNGFECIGKGCPSNDHFNGVKDTHHTSGGYALKQSWQG